jgi:hypothetical protein
MAPGNPVEKPVIRQVSDREPPSVALVKQAALPTDRSGGTTAAATVEPPSPPRQRTGGRPRRRPDVVDSTITRGYVAWYLGVDVSTVRRLEARGQLHPRIGAGGIRYFDMHEIKRVRTRRLGRLADQTADVRLAAFARFQRGHDWRDVAIKLHYDPYRIYRLWRLYTSDRARPRG